jgi:hypothetical protein
VTADVAAPGKSVTWPGRGQTPSEAEQNVGHGHVFPRPDGRKKNCGGPGICPRCTEDAPLRAGQEQALRADAAPALGLLAATVASLEDESTPASRAVLLERLRAADADLRALLVPPRPRPPKDLNPPVGLDARAHARECGLIPHGHGSACHRACPTCGGLDEGYELGTLPT